jgi:hypothetical protein
MTHEDEAVLQKHEIPPGQTSDWTVKLLRSRG